MNYYRRMLVVALLVAVTALGAQGKKKSEDGIPADKKEIVDRFLARTLDASYTPALFFGHFGNGQKLGEGALKAHLSLFLKGGADIRGCSLRSYPRFLDKPSEQVRVLSGDPFRVIYGQLRIIIYLFHPK